MDLRSDAFGTDRTGHPIERWTFTNAGHQISLITFGARLQSWITPDNVDILLGYDDAESYLVDETFMGATIGRYANRIRGGRFELDGTEYVVPPNDEGNALHGGADGFFNHIWTATPVYDGERIGVRMQLESPDGDMGFPGTLTVSATYLLNADGDLAISYAATTDRPTVLNLTNHAYFNLAGHDSGDVRSHALRLGAATYSPAGPDLLPSGPPQVVAGTAIDFGEPHPISARWDLDDPLLRAAGGYDHNLVLDGVLAATLQDPSSGRTLTVTTDQPAMQFYTGQQIPAGLRGKGGATYGPYAGLCLETQHFPDSPNNPTYPTTVLRPGDNFSSTTRYSVDR